jgi:rhodanese-related sulfurtransferase
MSESRPLRTATVFDVAALAAPQLIDVREVHEFANVHAAGAVNIPLGEISTAEIAPSPDPVYVICRSGARSARAVEILAVRGVDAVNVEGGTEAWLQAGLPVGAPQ